MYIFDLEKEYEVNSLKELNDILAKRLKNNSNHYVLAFERGGLPELSSFVKKDCCVMYYMTEEENFISLGNEKEHGLEYFQDNQTDSQIGLPKASVLPIDKLYEAGRLFFETKNQPSVINWDEI